METDVIRLIHKVSAIRAFDLLFSVVGLFFGLPIIIIIYVIGLIDSGSPLFFQQRVGKDRRLFTLVKFRTMKKDTESVGTHDVDFAAITGIGKFLRKTKLDELPQLLNVLRGEMSLVGPRPTLRYQVEQYDERQRRRLSVLPGLTGWAQIHGRNQLTWPKRIELDLWYLDHWSLWLDLKILMRTPWILFRSEGLYGRKENFRIRTPNGGESP